MTAPPDPTLLLSGRVALVTGGGTGIGKAIAVRFAQAGARVAVSGRTARTLEETAAGFGGLALQADVAVEADVEAMFDAVRSAYGRLDVLVINAGVPGPIMGVDEMDVAAWDACLATNLRGAMLCSKYGSAMMKRAGSGSIIMMSSLMGLQGYPMRTAYCASKFALMGMTEAMARELGPFGVRVNALCPGAVAGENMDRIIARRAAAEGRPAEEIIAESYTNVAALRRWVSEGEVAEAALFYAGAQSAAMTGGHLKVDAGRF